MQNLLSIKFSFLSIISFLYEMLLFIYSFYTQFVSIISFLFETLLLFYLFHAEFIIAVIIDDM